MSLKLRRFWIQVTADRKRFGALCAVVAVGMLLWARLIVVSRMPRMAVADEPAPTANVTDLKSQKPATNVPSPVTVAIDREPVRVELFVRPQHDPFVISPRYFPRPLQFTEPGKEAGKSGPKAAEEPFQIEARITAQLRSVANRLRLEAAVAGSLVVINSKTYRIGDTIPGPAEGGESVQFRLVDVHRRSAILECEARRFEIQMASPGG